MSTIPKKFKDHPKFIEIFTKMFEMVGADISTFDIDQEFWFNKHQWTQDQENEFRRWLIDKIYNERELRSQKYFDVPKNKKLIEQTVRWFLLNYGWKIR